MTGLTEVPAWEVEARKRLEELPIDMQEIQHIRTAHLADAQQCTRKLEAMRAEQRKLRRLLDGIDGDGEAEEAQDDV